MKRRKLLFTWELLDTLLKLNGAKIYNSTIKDYGLELDVYGLEMEHVEEACNCRETFNSLNWEELKLAKLKDYNVKIVHPKRIGEITTTT